MSLTRVQVTSVRNLDRVDIQLHPQLNLFYGLNGSGKTSVLEAVYLLGTGRSFRYAQIQPLIQNAQEVCTVYGEIHSAPHLGSRTSHRLGVSRSRKDGREIRIDGEDVHQSSQLARILPLLVLGPDTVELVTGAPSGRRSFLNWGVFHVEQGYAQTWSNANRVLKQRNQILRSQRLDKRQFNLWTEELVRYCRTIDENRRSYMKFFSPVFKEIARSLLALEEVKCSYQRGWDEDSDIEDVFSRQSESEIHRRTTLSGFHRADLKLTIKGQPVDALCSRGELKVVAWAMILAQGAVYSSQIGQNSGYLVDDMPAELDKGHQEKIARILLDQGGQVLATGITSESLQAAWHGASRALFHVKQGKVTEETANE